MNTGALTMAAKHNKIDRILVIANGEVKGTLKTPHVLTSKRKLYLYQQDMLKFLCINKRHYLSIPTGFCIMIVLAELIEQLKLTSIWLVAPKACHLPYSRELHKHNLRHLPVFLTERTYYRDLACGFPKAPQMVIIIKGK